MTNPVADAAVAGDDALSVGLAVVFLQWLVGLDGDLDGDGTATDLFALEKLNSLRLLSLVTDIDEAVSLALARVTPTAADDASRVDSNARFCEQRGQAGVVNGEA